MKTTIIRELANIELKNPILVEGLPGLGMVGRIATRYLAKQLKAKKLARLHSPHFPYYVLVDKKGSVRLLHGEFMFWKNKAGENDFIFFTGDSQAQTIEGQYEVADCILDFAEKNNVRIIVTIGGYRKEVEKKPNVVAVSTSSSLLNQALKSKALRSSAGNPIVGTAGILLGLAKLRKMEAICLLGETRGYLPDPEAAKSVVEVLGKMFGIEVDISELHKDIEKSKEIVERMQEIEKRREKYAQKMRRVEEERITYIS